MSTGIVKFFNAKKGFGFIIDDETKEDIFVHSSGLIDNIQENDHVSYEIQEDSRGKKAVSVKVVNE
ncbi:MAG: cold shock domain-containing protein [Bacteroidales bacterium]|nr:cold shock domain-containing protein [Bacteroidales bacterium]